MKVFALILWMIFTIILVFSIVGMVLFVPKDTYQNHENTPSTWMTIGRKLLDSVINS